MTLHAVRVSKTSFKKWDLYGPLDQALKTSCQADEVKVIPVSVTVHDTNYDLELWLNSTPGDQDGNDEPNPHAQTLLRWRTLREKGITNAKDLTEDQFDEFFGQEELVNGVAVLTAAGLQDFPFEDEHFECVLATLIGMHHESNAS